MNSIAYVEMTDLVLFLMATHMDMELTGLYSMIIQNNLGDS